jgi:putative SOS response-associated peptidase YedK
MCGRYTLYGKHDLGKRFKAKNSVLVKRDNYNVAPGQYMPVVIKSEVGVTLEPMKWGLVPMWAKDVNIGYKMINARAESVFEKPAWRGPIKYHRCLVPATGFYEWKLQGDSKSKQPYFIKPKDQELFAFAGVFDSNIDARGNELWSFSIVTTEPNKEMASLHNRMPVILQPEDESTWLEPSLQDRGAIEALLRPYHDGGLEIYRVSEDVNSTRNNDEHLVYALSE